VDEQRAVISLTGINEREAQTGLDWLVGHCSAFVRASLRKRFPLDAELVNDLCQETFIKLWVSRKTITWQGTGAFYSLLQRAAWHCYVDYWRKYRKYEEATETPEVYLPQGEESREIEQCLAALAEAGRLHWLNHQANLHWLGLDPALSPEMHNRRLLAAQYFYLDGASPDEILRLLPPASPGESAFTRQRLEEWLSSPDVLRYLAYTELYYSNERLTAHLLGLDAFAEPFEEKALSNKLDALMKTAVRALHDSAQTAGTSSLNEGNSRKIKDVPPPPGWEWREVALLFWRIRYALPENIISRHCGFDLSDEELQKLSGKCAARFPFSERMQTLLAALEPAANRHEIFDSPGLWQRLTFQYGVRDGLGHKDILERTQPAAQFTDFEMNTMRLHGWLSNRRLEKYLIDFCKRS
jgi:hypothetical protein